MGTIKKGDPATAATRKQIADSFDRAIENAKNPDPRIKMKQLRKEKAKKVVKNYGF